MRRWHPGGLCAPRRHLASNEDRRRACGARARTGQDAIARSVGVHGHCEPLDAARFRAYRGTLVFDTEHFLSLAGADPDCTDRVCRLAFARPERRAAAVLQRDWSVPAGLSRTCNLGLSVSRAAFAHVLADGSRAREPYFHADRHASAVADHLWLYRIHLLAVPRQGARRRELPLTVLVSRIRSSHILCCEAPANFGFKGTPESLVVVWLWFRGSLPTGLQVLANF